jgi:dihydrofolate synthase / folylpolyglutamate synthase
VKRSLPQWLEYIEGQHPASIALGLERVDEVLAHLDARLTCPVITVAGTNGKGSTCAMLESILRAGGYRTGLYTSPHLLRYNERVRTCGAEAGDEALCEAFGAVEHARRGVPLTYFEFGTLAALWLFASERLDAAVLEVGLGGRLDAVNAVEPDCAVLTSIGIDHVEYLGGTRESIGLEKAGIFRSGRPAVVGDPDPPASVVQAARALGARLLLINRDFGYVAESNLQWSYWGPGVRRPGLAHPALRGAKQLLNASSALCALDCLREKLPLAMQELRRGLAEVSLPGRFQVLPGRPQVVLDVAHNPQAARALASDLASSGFAPETIAVCGMLRDKDIEGVLAEMAPRISRWHLAPLSGPRGAPAAELAARLRTDAPVALHESPVAALRAAQDIAGEDDKIVVFGSFLTVGEIMAWLKNTTSMR